jgi:hypothetical protein
MRIITAAQEFPAWNQDRARTLEARNNPPSFSSRKVSAAEKLQQQKSFSSRKEVHREIQTGQA